MTKLPYKFGAHPPMQILKPNATVTVSAGVESTVQNQYPAPQDRWGILQRHDPARRVLGSRKQASCLITWSRVPDRSTDQQCSYRRAQGPRPLRGCGLVDELDQGL